MTDEMKNKSAGDLLSDALGNVSALVRSEVDLARAEISENVSKAGVAFGLIAGGAIVVLVALNVLAVALTAALTELGLDASWSALIVGIALAVIAYALIAKGLNDLKLFSLAPTRTAKNVQRDATAVKEAYDDQ
ncbi:phage holin family protein [Gymnodinialimonas sp. 2305UL16-5]|uniref:phage holin family protein n=1 Tax=Gymnodinialimonas mytili TaxID=3126503 RepID=UPI0030AE1B06